MAITATACARVSASQFFAPESNFLKVVIEDLLFHPVALDEVQ
jgi:hypothetical protein